MLKQVKLDSITISKQKYMLSARLAVLTSLARTSASHADDPGSNPGDRTIKTLEISY
jgi:hypothetical protein